MLILFNLNKPMVWMITFIQHESTLMLYLKPFLAVGRKKLICCGGILRGKIKVLNPNHTAVIHMRPSNSHRRNWYPIPISHGTFLTQFNPHDEGGPFPSSFTFPVT